MRGAGTGCSSTPIPTASVHDATTRRLLRVWELSTYSWLSALDKLPAIHDRMRRVQIECCDWRVVLDRYSGSGWLAYCDPPYVTEARRAGGYEHELSDRDHQELVDRLLAYDGAGVLSGYRSAIYAPLEAAGWEVREVPTVCSAAGRTRASGLQGKGNVKRRQPRTEVLWIKPT